MTRRCTHERLALPPRGLSMVEVTISMVIIGVMMVAALTTLSGVMRAKQIDQQEQIARTLAELLMAEIMSKEYQEPTIDGTSFGLETGEAATGDRSLFDDVDDYDGWSAIPPQWPDGVTIPERDDWGRSVDVACVSPANPTTELSGTLDYGLKRIIVTVTYDGVDVTTLTAVRGMTKEY